MINFSEEEINFINTYDTENKEIFFYLFYLCKKYPNGVYDFNKMLNKIFRHRIKNEYIVNIIGEKYEEKPFYVYIHSFSIVLKLNDFMYNFFDYNDIAFTINDNKEYDNEIILYYKKESNPEKYTCCERCGKIIERVTNRKYCKSCAKTIRKERDRLRVRKYRKKKI